MKLSLRYDVRVPEQGSPATEIYRCAIEQCSWADQRGFHSVYLGEHHGADDGYLPSPMVYGAAIAQATSRMQIHLSALVAVLHHPLRLAEDLAVLDLLSNGRLEATLGMGYVPSEYPMFGILQEDRVARLVETLEVLPKAWTGEPFDFRGTQVTVRPRPVRPAGPPVFVGANTDAAARRAARLGAAFNPPTRAVYDVYAAECARLGRVAPPGPNRHDMQFVFVSDDPERDWPLVTPYVLEHHNSYAAMQAQRATDQRNFRTFTTTAELQADPRYNVWTPDECATRFGALAADEEFVLQPLVGGMAPELSWQSLQRLENDVLPRLVLETSPSP